MDLLIKQHASALYQPRTKYNAQSASFTIAFATNFSTHGEKQTKSLAGKRYLPFSIFETNVDEFCLDVFQMIRRYGPKINIAGNGIYTLLKYNINQQEANQLVFEVIKSIHHECPISKIFSGGQTGIDLAGAISGVKLDIPTEVTLPFGFRQRIESGVDINQSYDSILFQIQNGVDLLV